MTNVAQSDHHNLWSSYPASKLTPRKRRRRYMYFCGFLWEIQCKNLKTGVGISALMCPIVSLSIFPCVTLSSYSMYYNTLYVQYDAYMYVLWL